MRDTTLWHSVRIKSFAACIVFNTDLSAFKSSLKIPFTTFYPTGLCGYIYCMAPPFGSILKKCIFINTAFFTHVGLILLLEDAIKLIYNEQTKYPTLKQKPTHLQK